MIALPDSRQAAVADAVAALVAALGGVGGVGSEKRQQRRKPAKSKVCALLLLPPLLTAHCGRRITRDPNERRAS